MIRLVLIISLLIPLVAGCRQGATGTTAARPSAFDFSRWSPNALFGRSPNRSQGYVDRNGQYQIEAGGPEEFKEYSALAQQINSLNQQVGSFDSDNQQLYSEIAGLKQKLQVANDYNNQIRQQLTDNSYQFQQLQSEKQNLEQQLAEARAQVSNGSQYTQQPNERFASNRSGTPTQLLGGATVRANNSLLQKLSAIRIPGGQARMDGDVIRVEFPSDNIFTPGTYQIRPEQTNTVRNIATTIRQYFPSQIIGVEAHWDGTQLNPPTTTHHQLTATQALAVFNQLVQMGLPADQLFTMAMGSNRPRHPQNNVGGVSPNRRIEIVIYPETYNGT